MQTPGLVFLFNILILAFHLNANAQYGNLDYNFGINGRINTDINGANDVAWAVTTQADGKILAAGQSQNSTVSGAGTDFTIVRYNLDGSLDTSFDYDGIVTANYDWAESAHDIVIDANNKILIAGTSSGSVALLRFNMDGSPDTTFDHDGVVLTGSLFGTSTANHIALQPDGKIVFAGSRFVSGNNFLAGRFNANGSIDSTFNSTGFYTTSFSPGEDALGTVAIQPDGKIVCAGTYEQVTGIFQSALLRLTPGGIPDVTFGTSGFSTCTSTLFENLIESIVLTPSGKIIAAGAVKTGSGYNQALWKFTNNGSADFAFGNAGMVQTGFFTYGLSISLTPENKILAGGYGSWTPVADFALARYDTTGAIDTTFGVTGLVFTDINNNDVAYAMHAAADGSIVLAGFSDGGIGQDFAIARFFGTTVNTHETTIAGTGINAYPNPASGLINVSLNQPVNNAAVKLIDLTGQTLMQQNNISGNSFTLDVSTNPPGIYFIQLTVNEKIVSKKLVKE